MERPLHKENPNFLLTLISHLFLRAQPHKWDTRSGFEIHLHWEIS